MSRLSTLLFPAVLFIFLIRPVPSFAADPVEVVVYGVGGDALDNVRKALALPYGLIQDNKVNGFWLDRFSAQIPEKTRLALEPFGYYNAAVQTRIETPEQNRYRIVVSIEPGQPVRVTQITIAVHGEGSGESVLKMLVSRFPLKKGDILLQKKYEEAKGGLRFQAIQLGYLDADFSSHRIEVDREHSTARVDLEMETGPRYRFGDVSFEGAPHYPDSFLRRYLAFKPGDFFSYAKLSETQLNLINTDRFKTIFPVPQKEKAQDDHVPVLIRLEEAPSKRLRPGIGYSTDIGPSFTLQYRDLNVFERGHEFHSELQLSNSLDNLGAGYVLPDPKNINSLLSLQLNLRREDVTTYTNRIASAEVDRTTGFSRGRLGTLYLKLDRENATVGSETVNSRLVIPGLRFDQRRYDNLVRPKNGFHYSIDAGGTHQALGSNTRFVQITTQENFLLPLPWRLSLFSRAQVGVTYQNEPITDLPVSYRFFAGGDQSVRGYAYQSLGPTDATGAVIGGRDILVASVELDRALFTNWAVAAFYDTGNAFNAFTDMNLQQGAGIGVRYYTVVGALRLDVARQLAVEHPSYRIHFTVGFAF